MSFTFPNYFRLRLPLSKGKLRRRLRRAHFCVFSALTDLPSFNYLSICNYKGINGAGDGTRTHGLDLGKVSFEKPQATVITELFAVFRLSKRRQKWPPTAIKWHLSDGVTTELRRESTKFIYPILQSITLNKCINSWRRLLSIAEFYLYFLINLTSIFKHNLKNIKDNNGGFMAKRFTDTEKWKRKNIRTMSAEQKLLWFYILDNCDNTGVWHVDIELASFQIGINILESHLLSFGDKIEWISDDKIFIQDFIDFQYGTLSHANNAHKPVILLLTKLGKLAPKQPLNSPSRGAQDKDKDKAKAKDKAIKKSSKLLPTKFSDSLKQEILLGPDIGEVKTDLREMKLLSVALEALLPKALFYFGREGLESWVNDLVDTEFFSKIKSPGEQRNYLKNSLNKELEAVANA